MIPKSYRLLLRGFIDKENPLTTVVGKYVRCVVFANDFTLGNVVVTKRFSLQAVQRNRVKRQLRSVLYTQLSGIDRHYAVVLFPRPLYKKVSFKEVSNEVAKLLSQVTI